MTAPQVTAELQAEADALAAVLKHNGYRDASGASGFTVGQRVRHRGQQYMEAYRGTATVTHVLQASPRDVELVVVRDQPIVEGMSRVSNWANYSTCEVHP